MTTDLYSDWTLSFIDSLYQSGVQQIVISPGSRSTPLALAALSHPNMVCNVIVDERSAAFFAIGQIRHTGNPSVLICTSGSAGAHYFPAIMEASLTHLPLIVITADRPWELQECGANQTTRQQYWYGNNVKIFLELGEPPHTDNSKKKSVAARIGMQAIYTAVSPPMGPVHVNARFRKPLEPCRPLTYSQKGNPHPSLPFVPEQRLPKEAISQLTHLCRQYRNGMIVCGPGPMGPNAAIRQKSVTAFAQKTGYPVFAEMASGIKAAHAPFVHNASAWFNCATGGLPLPELIIEIHRPLTTAAYERFINHCPDIPRVVLSHDRYVDFSGTATAVYTGDIGKMLDGVTCELEETASVEGMAAVRKFDRLCESVQMDLFDETVFNEASAIRCALKVLTDKHTFCIGNSMVIRDLDMFPVPTRCCTIHHQRGASGIDGLISSAAGTASVEHNGVLLVVGDVSALHDLGGFAVACHASTPLVILIINNDGGQIFNQLPLAKLSDVQPHFTRGFVIPGTPSFRGVCDMFNIPWTGLSNIAELAAKLQIALQTPGTTVLEAQIKVDSAYRSNYIKELNIRLSKTPVS